MDYEEDEEDPLSPPSGEIQLNEGGDDELDDEGDDTDEIASDEEQIDTVEEDEEEKPRKSLKGVSLPSSPSLPLPSSLMQQQPRRFLRLPNNFSSDSTPAPGRIRNWFRREIGELFSSDGVLGDPGAINDPTCDRFMEQQSDDLKYDFQPS
jgi:hypothetical protein